MQRFDSGVEKSAVEELSDTGIEHRDLWSFDVRTGRWDTGPHMLHAHTVHLPLGALLIPCTVCGAGK